MLAVVSSPLYLYLCFIVLQHRLDTGSIAGSTAPGYALVSSQSVVEGHLSVLGRLGQDSVLFEVPLEFQSIRLEDE